jgi:hypothetical protein
MIDETKMATVYHVSRIEHEGKIKSEGLKSFYDLYPECRGSKSIKDIREILDCRFNRSAPEGIDKRKMIYALPSEERAQEFISNVWRDRKNEMLLLQIKVDPTKTLVADISYYTKALNMCLYSEYAPDNVLNELIESYWNSAMLLDQYSQLDHNERKERIPNPELLVNGPVDSSLISVSNGGQ